MPTTKETLRIPDMHCERCATRIATVLGRLEGVRQADVSFDRKDARVEYDEETVSRDDLEEAIENAGYTAQV